MTWFMVDVESDGPIPGDYSMFQLGIVVVEPKPATGWRSFLGRFRPLPGAKFDPKPYEMSGVTRETVMGYEDAAVVTRQAVDWVEATSGGRAMLISDNNGFDAMFVAWYFHRFTGGNPFGHSSTNLGSLYKGLVKDMRQNFKHLRRTSHDHNPVNDAIGNVEALLQMREMGLKIQW